MGSYQFVIIRENINAMVGDRRYRRSAINALGIAGLPFAFRVESVVDHKLLLKNLVIR